MFLQKKKRSKKSRFPALRLSVISQNVSSELNHLRTWKPAHWNKRSNGPLCLLVNCLCWSFPRGKFSSYHSLLPALGRVIPPPPLVVPRGMCGPLWPSIELPVDRSQGHTCLVKGSSHRVKSLSGFEFSLLQSPSLGRL